MLIRCICPFLFSEVGLDLLRLAVAAPVGLRASLALHGAGPL